MYIKHEDVAGYRLNGGVVCVECAKSIIPLDIPGCDDIITRKEINEDKEGTYYCDECKEAL